MALKFKRPETQAQLRWHIADIEERMQECSKCNYKGIFLRNGYMIKRSLPTHIQKIKKYKCPKCEESIYENKVDEIEIYHTSILRLILHLYIEGISQIELIKILKEKDIRIPISLIKKSISSWRQKYGYIINRQLKTKQVKTAKDYIINETYIYGLCIQESDDFILCDFSNGKMKGSLLLDNEDIASKYSVYAIWRIAFHLYLEGMKKEDIKELLDERGFEYSNKELKKFFIEIEASCKSIFNTKEIINDWEPPNYKRGVWYIYSLLIIEKENEILYEVVNGKMKNLKRKLYNPELDSYLEMKEQDKLARRKLRSMK